MALFFFILMGAAAAAEFILVINDMTSKRGTKKVQGASWQLILLGRGLSQKSRAEGLLMVDKREDNPKGPADNRDDSKHRNYYSGDLVNHNKLFQPELFPEYIDGCA